MYYLAMANIKASYTSDPAAVYMARLERAVLAGGGCWIGLQQAFDNFTSITNMVVFKADNEAVLQLPAPSPEAFSDSEFSKLVRKKIDEVYKRVGERKISVTESTLSAIRQQAQSVVDAIDALLRGKP